MSKGFSVRRRNTCKANEEDCGMTDEPYRACCPESSFCPKQYNIDCCPTEKNCTSELIKEPKCADETWDLYDNHGYFCCAPGLLGYNSTRNSNGCASPGYEFEGGEKSLTKVKAGKPVQNSGPGTPVGAIAGGVIGGVAALALAITAIWWFFLRKRKSKGFETPGRGSAPSPKTLQEMTEPPRELDGNGGAAAAKPSELEGREKEVERSELAGRSVRLAEQDGVTELPG